MLLSPARAQNSNVVRFFSLLKKDDRREQMVYYQVRERCCCAPLMGWEIDRTNHPYLRLLLPLPRSPSLHMCVD